MLAAEVNEARPALVVPKKIIDASDRVLKEDL